MTQNWIGGLIAVAALMLIGLGLKTQSQTDSMDWQWSAVEMAGAEARSSGLGIWGSDLKSEMHPMQFGSPKAILLIKKHYCWAFFTLHCRLPDITPTVATGRSDRRGLDRDRWRENDVRHG